MNNFSKTINGNSLGWFIGRHEEGVIENELEFLLNGDGLIMLFDSKEDAVLFLRRIGSTDDDIKDSRFFVHTVCSNCGEQQNVHELELSEDNLGIHTTCDNCLSSFDVTF